MPLSVAAMVIGSQLCRPCHLEIYDSYARTPMAQSSGRVAPLAAASFSAAGQRYRVAGNTLFFDGGQSTIDYFIGSNAAGRSFLRAYDGYLFELPVTWYAQKRAWDASPGYEKESQVRLTRAVEPSCLQCHASRVRPVLGTQNRYGTPPFLENGVACERCHGPGSEHVKDPAVARMVNPARLGPERRDGVCSQCHLSGEARIERTGRRFAEYQAGDRLADYATYFVRQLGRRDLKVTSHVEKLAASACKLASGDKLWCGTCHDPHTNEDKSQAACLSCHAGAHRPEERCVTCHMPKARTSDGNHGVMTDHSIPRTPRAPAPPSGGLTAFGSTADDRAIGLAYAELQDARALPYLRRAVPQDWPVRLRLAVQEPDPARATQLYESVLRDNPHEPAALVNLGALYAQQGRLTEAAALWERALVTNAALEEAVLNLARVRAPAETRLILERYRQVNPAFRPAPAKPR
ncbi:MAG: tetratricopeptide repeat protein [Bryobacteraceae bacterium]|nr:tetratricopeptide repeat protein [Bryobacteraceae bacterium]